MFEIFQSFGMGFTGAVGAPMLPLAPALAAWAWAAGRDSGGQRAVPALGFAAGFALGFAALNASGSIFITVADIGAVLAGFAVAAYGVHALGAFRIPGAKSAAAVLGFAFAFGWTPMPSAALAAAADDGFAATAAYGAGLAAVAWIARPVLGRVGDLATARKLAGMTLFATGLAIAGGFLAEAGFALDAVVPALRALG